MSSIVLFFYTDCFVTELILFKSNKGIGITATAILVHVHESTLCTFCLGESVHRRGVQSDQRQSLNGSGTCIYDDCKRLHHYDIM